MSPSRIVSLSVAVSCLLLAGNCRSQNPSSPDKSPRIFSIVSGKSAHVCVRPVGDRACHRLTTRDGGWETGGVISPDGELVAYSSGDTPLTRSEIWVSRLDG